MVSSFWLQLIQRIDQTLAILKNLTSWVHLIFNSLTFVYTLADNALNCTPLLSCVLNFLRLLSPVHRGVICQFPIRWIYYCNSRESTGNKTGKMHVCAVVGESFRKINARIHQMDSTICFTNFFSAWAAEKLTRSAARLLNSYLS